MPATKANPKAAKKSVTKKPAKTPAGTAKKLSALDAAARVLAESGGSMSTTELIAAMAQKKLWESPNGKTPAATLHAALSREIATRGADRRFRKTAPGRFAATGTTGTAEVGPTAKKPVKATKAVARTPKAKGAQKRPAARKAEPAPVATTIPDGTPGPQSLQELFRI